MHLEDICCCCVNILICICVLGHAGTCNLNLFHACYHGLMHVWQLVVTCWHDIKRAMHSL